MTIQIYLKQLMADVIKVKSKKQYEWSQDPKFVYIQIPLPNHTSLKKVSIFLSDLILRVTSEETKSTNYIDLWSQVDCGSPENKFVMIDGVLHATLRKVKNDQWAALIVEDISLAELKVRRRESQARWQSKQKEGEELKDKLRTQYDRKATQQLMRFQEEERKKLDSKKQAEKDSAIREIFSNVNEKTGKIEKKLEITEKTPYKLEYQQSKWKQKERIALSLIQKQQEQQSKLLQKQRKQKNEEKIVEEVKKKYGKTNTNTTMFTEQQIQANQALVKAIDDPQEEYEQIPVRNTETSTLKVKFTQRKYPNLAARDTFYKDPPMPTANKANKAGSGDLQTKNPLWLKDKGDRFHRDRNYIAAIEAYTQAIKIDGKLLTAYLNRSLSYIKLFKLDEAINDCETCLSLMQSQLPSSTSQAERDYFKRMFVKISMRKAMCLAWKGDLVQAATLMEEIKGQKDVGKQIQSAIEVIKKREESLKFKIRGDQHFKLGQLAKSAQFYDKSIAIDQNQHAIINKLLVLNKQSQFSEALTLSSNLLTVLNSFNISSSLPSSSTTDKQSKLLLLKLYYRKGKAHEGKGQLHEAQETIRKGLMVEPGDADLTAFLKRITQKKVENQVNTLKQKAATLIKQGNFKESLDIYAKCLKLTPATNLQAYLSILQNQCVCYLKLSQPDSIIAQSNRILRIIQTQRNRIVSFNSSNTQRLDKAEMDKIEVRTLMRRANAYGMTGQVYNAKGDLQRALQVAPGDEIVAKELKKVKQQISTL